MKTLSTQKKGFTLIEMLVAVALFSIVLMIAMGSIMTIVDVNRKSQTLTSVMNDLNFSLENVTRSIKTGNLQTGSDTDGGDFPAITVVDKLETIPRTITYGLDTNGHITRAEEDGDAVPITSDQVTINSLFFRIFWDDNNRQPRVLMVIEGTAEASQSISSSFRIQTTVSQRDLDTNNFQ